MTQRSSNLGQISRRQALRLGVGAAVGALATAASAQDMQMSFDSQAEWKDRFDASASGVSRTSASRTPTLSQETVEQTERAIQDYTGIVSRGGWTDVPKGPRLKLGSSGERVLALRQRLAATGDLDPNLANGQVFDSYVEGAVKRFQARHGLIPVGVVGDDTMTSLNIPAQTRLRQLETNLVRIRTMAGGNIGERYVMVNIPAAEVEAVAHGQVEARYTAVVGKVDRASPVLDAKIQQVNFNPTWTVPASIIRKDLIPQMQKDPQYLTKKNIRIIAPSGEEVQPTEIDWNSMDGTKYMYRQDSGDDNSMGNVRINMPNKDGVYMHDTPSKGYFGENARFLSSGCVRVQNVRELVGWLAKAQPNWDRRQIDAAIKTGQRIDINLTPYVPVYWRYISGWGAPTAWCSSARTFMASTAPANWRWRADRALKGPDAMTDGRAGPSRRGGGPAVSASGEVLFEFVTRGNAVRCAAIDAATGIEVVVVGPANAAEAHLRMVALRKLKLRLERG